VEAPADAVEAAADAEAQLEEFELDPPSVAILMGSKSDLATMAAAETELAERGIRSEVRIMSAHREPDTVAEYARGAKLRGLVAAHTELPVIGVPLTSRTSVAGGLDALLSVSQMPPGVPVACVGVDNARNAAILAARILAA
jgi:phosphoribosylcarboxyaminoimidazole (NCAIR) mutase